jgi:hypothetical protein
VTLIKKRTVMAAITGLAVAAIAAAGLLASGAVTTSSPTLAMSSTPKEVVINPTTGAVLSVTQISAAQLQALR